MRQTRPSTTPTENPLELLALGQAALFLNNTELAPLLNVSRRTVSRWYSKQSPLHGTSLATLAEKVHEKDPALAARIRAYADQELARYHIPLPPPLPAPPAPPPPPPPADTAPPAPPPKTLLDGVVCAACDALDASPRVVRPVLLAAFRRARELGLSVEAVERELSPPQRAQQKKGGAADR